MSDKHDQTNGESRKKSSGELDAARGVSGRGEAESGTEVKADSKSEGRGKASAGARPKANSKRQAGKRSGGKQPERESKKKKQETGKAKDEVTEVVEEAEADNAGMGKPGRDSKGRYLPGCKGAGARGTANGNEGKSDGSGSEPGSGASLMTEAGQKRLVCKLLGKADTLAANNEFKLSAADLIRLIQLQKEMTPKQPRKVTVQWVEDKSE
jgi:hypothetical protein